MLLSCKCLNFIATSGNANKMAANDEAAFDCNNSLPAALMQSFLQRYPRNFVFYSPCMDFFKQSIGPIADLTINALNQRDLIYSLTLDLSHTHATSSSWQLSICVNCNSALCAKRLSAFGGPNQTQQQYLINSALLTSNEEMAHRRTDKSFSETFGVLIMDHPTLKTPTTPPPASLVTNFSVGSAAGNIGVSVVDCKQQRLRQLQQNLQQRLKREIAETDERIQRYTEQQFALLKSFREKSEQEYELLVRLIQQVPEQHVGSGEWWLDRSPPTLEVNGAAPLGYASRRRNTITSRRELNGTMVTAPTTPTTPSVIANTVMGTAPIFPTSSTAAATNMNSSSSSLSTTTTTTAASVSASASATVSATATATSAMDGNSQGNNRTANSSSGIITTATTALQRKLSNFDTPPATPEATPMSVGNSPTFRQQQQQTVQGGPQMPPQSFGNNVRLLTTQMSFQQQFPTPTAETNDDCIFELEGVEICNGGTSSVPMPAAAILSLQQQQFQRSLSNQQQQQQMQQRESNAHYMSDLDESDADAEEAEDALDMESSAPITMKHVSGLRINNNNNNNNNTAAQMMNYAKSLPIDIANSPLIERGMARPNDPFNEDVEEDELDNTVDIAASIKALAKSVHGEAVFGDLPRPRLRSQI